MWVGRSSALRAYPRPSTWLRRGVLVVSLLAPPASAADIASCSALFFGVEGRSDAPAAHACFSRLREGARAKGLLPPGTDALSLYAPLILMHLEGRGTSVDLDEVAKLLEEWKQIGRDGIEPRLFLHRVWLERKSGLGVGSPRIRFCDLPGDDAFRLRCEEIDRRRRVAIHERRLREIRDRVPKTVRAGLGSLAFAFEGYADREGERVRRLGPLDLLSGPDVSAHEALLDEHFAQALRSVLVARDVHPATGIEAQRIERNLTQAYDADRREKKEAFRRYEDSLPDSADEYQRYRHAYEAAAARAQDAWGRYRDAWVDVARAGAPGGAGALDQESRVRAMLARQRMSEIRRDSTTGSNADLLNPPVLR